MPNGVVTIATNGKPDASLDMGERPRPTADEPTMVLAAALPLALADAPKNAAIIGFGSGLTTHSLLADQRLKSVDTIEIEQAMVDERVSLASVWNAHIPIHARDWL